MPVAPKRSDILKELVAVRDFISLIHPRTQRVSPEYSLSGKHIVLFPGLGVDSRYFKPLSKFLEKHGHHTHDWGMGVNDAGLKRDFSLDDLSDSWHADPVGKQKPINTKELGVPYLCSQATERMRSLSDSLNKPLVLLGWSLGGYIAREVARDLPEQVCQVITFGTPTLGGPKYTSTANSFLKAGVDIDWIEREILKRDAVPITQPITLIRARYDGIVHESASGDDINPQVTMHEVNSSHVGMGFHYPMWQLLLKALL